jgi:hypothetical protein
VAAAAGTIGPERGFALYVLGRTTIASDPAAALAALAEAESIFASRPEMALHRAHVLFHLAAFALSQGDYASARLRAEAALPTAQRHENAALLANLLLVRAEALDAEGQRADAAALRLDSLGLARYGFGSDQAIRDRTAEITGLSPANEG